MKGTEPSLDRKPPVIDLTRDDDHDAPSGSGPAGGRGIGRAVGAAAAARRQRALPAPPVYQTPATDSKGESSNKRPKEEPDATTQRVEDIKHGRVVPSAAERMQMSASQAPTLERHLHHGGRTQGLRPPGKSRTRSGEEVRENLEDDDDGDEDMDRSRRFIGWTEEPDDDVTRQRLGDAHNSDLRGYLDDDEEIG